MTSKAGCKPAFFIVWIVCGFLLGVTSCHKISDEEQIKQIITEMVTATEQAKFADIAKHLDNNFQANGQMSVDEVKQLLLAAGLQRTSISIHIISQQTTIDPVYAGKAETIMSVLVTSGSSFAGLPSDGSARVVKLQWRKDDDWKILNADWQE